LIVSLATVVALSAPPRPPLRTEEGPLLPRAQLLRTIGASQLPLITDYYWLQTIQQVGRAVRPYEYRDIYAYADLVTDLDPRFDIVYRFAGVVIPVMVGRERWVNAEESTRIIRKGLQQFPGDYRLRFQLAYNLIFFDRKYREAAELIEALSREPNAPPFLKPLATRLYAQSGDFDSGLALASVLRDSAQDEKTRAFYEQRILQLHQERLLQGIDAAVQRFRKREGRLPADLQELVKAGELKAIPADPLGGTLSLDAKGRARSTAVKHRLEVIGAKP
jgi:hypothetical protein